MNKRSFEVPIYDESVAEVRKTERTKLHYTITPIGGKEDLVKWKAERVKIEEEWQLAQEPKRAERRAKAISGVSNQDAVKDLTEVEKKEISWLKSLRKTDVNRSNHSQPIRYFGERFSDEYEKASMSIKQKISNWFIKLFNDAFGK